MVINFGMTMFFFGFDRKTPVKGYMMLYLKMYKCNPFIEFKLHYKTGGYIFR